LDSFPEPVRGKGEQKSETIKSSEDCRRSPRFQNQVRGQESMVAAAVEWAERIMRKIDGAFPKSEARYFFQVS